MKCRIAVALLLLLTSFAFSAWMQDVNVSVADANGLPVEKASIEIFSEIVSGLKDLCQGIHIITIGAEDKLRMYLDAARLKKL